MRWEDAVLAAGQVAFVLALLPAIAAAAKPPRSTCAATAVTLYACCAALFSLELFWSCACMFVTGSCWLTLLVQRRSE